MKTQFHAKILELERRALTVTSSVIIYVDIENESK